MSELHTGAPLSIQLFGSLAITWQIDTLPSPQAIPLRSRARRLLIYLLLHRHISRPRDQIAFVLWQDMREADARATLRRALNDVRAVFPPGEWILSESNRLQWNEQAPYTLDVQEFERLVREGTWRALHHAIALYKDDLVPEIDDVWLVSERERLRQMQRDALEHLIAHHRVQGEWETALRLAGIALKFDPFAETIHRDIIGLKYALGDRAAALAHYERLRAQLHDELGVEPMHETQTLAAEIAQGAPLTFQVRAAPEDPSLPSRPQAAPLFGREREWDALDARWQKATEGRGGLVVVGGEAGIGKTHLALAFADFVEKQGGLALVGHCYEFEQALPYQPIVELLRAAGQTRRRAELSNVSRIALARLVPELFDVSVSSQEIGAEDSRMQLFEALRQAFHALARRQPLLLIFEDVHWAAESTLDWLTYLVSQITSARILVLLTVRAEEIDPQHSVARMERRFGRQGTVTTLALEPLSPQANRALVAQLSGWDETRAAPLAERLYQESGGNPLFVHELVRGLIEAGILQIRQGIWYETAGVDVTPPLPASLRATIRARVERLNEMSRMFLRATAVAGRVFVFESVRRTGNWNTESALGALEDLLTRGFVRPREGNNVFAPSGEFGFVHHLMQEAIYADLTPPRRVYWHGQMAGTLVEMSKQWTPTQRRAHAAEIAHHARHGEQWAVAFEYAPLAAEEASALYAYADALQHLETASYAFEQISAMGTPDEQQFKKYIDVLLTRMDLMPQVGGTMDIYRELLQRVEELLVEYPDPSQEATLALRRADDFSNKSDYTRAIEEALNAHARFWALHDVRGAAYALNEAARYKMTISQNRAARPLFEQALELYQGSRDYAGEARCLSGLGWLEINLGQIEHALAHLNRALELGQAHSDKPAMARVCVTLAAAWDYYYEAEKIGEYAQQSFRLYREIGYELTALRAELFLAAARHAGQEFAQAYEMYARIATEAHRGHDTWLEGWARQLMSRLLIRRGEYADAGIHLQRAYELRRESGELQNQISDLGWLGRLALARRDPARALEFTQRAMTQLDALWGEFYVWEMPDVFYTHAEALAANGELGLAAQAVERAYETLIEFAGQIQDAQVKHNFLTHPTNTRILKAREDQYVSPFDPTKV